MSNDEWCGGCTVLQRQIEDLKRQLAEAREINNRIDTQLDESMAEENRLRESEAAALNEAEWLREQLAAKDAEIERLRAYGQHLISCALAGDGDVCDCGYDALNSKGGE